MEGGSGRRHSTAPRDSASSDAHARTHLSRTISFWAPISVSSAFGTPERHMCDREDRLGSWLALGTARARVPAGFPRCSTPLRPHSDRRASIVVVKVLRCYQYSDNGGRCRSRAPGLVFTVGCCVSLLFMCCRVMFEGLSHS